MPAYGYPPRQTCKVQQPWNSKEWEGGLKGNMQRGGGGFTIYGACWVLKCLLCHEIERGQENEMGKALGTGDTADGKVGEIGWDHECGTCEENAVGSHFWSQKYLLFRALCICPRPSPPSSNVVSFKRLSVQNVSCLRIALRRFELFF